jgi:hypothetical protein
MKHLFRNGLILTAALLLAAGTVTAQQPIPVGGELQVNTTAGGQREPDVAMDAAGNFVVTWTDASNFSNEEVSAQLYDTDGNKVGGELRVNTTTVNDQDRSRVGMDATGNFVIVWHSFHQFFPPAIFSIMGQRYASDGTPVGSEFHIDVGLTSIFPDVAMDASGNFMAVWTGRPAPGPCCPSDVYARLYAADGTPKTSPFQVNTTPGASGADFKVAATADGGWIVNWGGPGGEILTQRYDGDGNPVGGEMVVTDILLGQSPAIGTGPNGYVVTWWNNLNPFDPVSAQRFDTSDNPVGDPFNPSLLPEMPTQDPEVAVGGNGDFVISWVERSLENAFTEQAIVPTRDGSVATVMARAYDADGNPLGNDFIVNTSAPGFHTQPSLASNGDSRLVATWLVNGNIYAQLYAPADLLVADTIAYIESLPLATGTKNALTSKLETALASLAAGNINAFANKINAFKNYIEAQSGKKITQADADVLLDAADALVASVTPEPPPTMPLYCPCDATDFAFAAFTAGFLTIDQCELGLGGESVTVVTSDFGGFTAGTELSATSETCFSELIGATPVSFEQFELCRDGLLQAAANQGVTCPPAP